MAVIAKYKFDSSIYADLIPTFNDGYIGYVITDEIDGENSNHIIRTIECDSLPTRIDFGVGGLVEQYTNKSDSLLAIYNLDTSAITDGSRMFKCCRYIIEINTSDWNTNNMVNMIGMFSYCTNLTSLDVSNFNTSKVITMQSMFANCTNLTSLDVSNFNTSNVTTINSMFYGCNNLTSITFGSNFNTSNVTSMVYMFAYCNNLTTLDLSNFDTSNVTNMERMFESCSNLTTLDLSNFDTSNVTNMSNMFYGCTNLTSLDVSNFNTSNVINMQYMFYKCTNLTSLDVSNFDTSKVTSMALMFANTPKLSDIGMLYCSQSTINTLSSNISTPSTNVWVEGSMIDDLTSYNNVTYKAYYWEKEVLLNSPLLEGDKIVKKDGKIYHYHKMGMIVLDGSEDENWAGYGIYSDVIGFYLPLKLENKNNYIYISDISIKQASYDIVEGGIVSSNEELFTVTIKNVKIIINKSRLSTTDVNGLKQWLSENPTTVVYELVNPYYELISDTSEDLSLSLLSEDNIISNNSLIPTNMNVKNNGMTTVAMQSSTKYTVAFDKDADSSVTIDLCGSTIDTTDNVVEITTPSELANDEITFIGDCEVSNVRILEGSVSGDAIPKESFEGLKNSFEDGYIPNNLITDMEYTLCNVPTNIIVGESAYPSFYIEGNNRIRTNLISVKPNTTYTTYTQLSELTVHHYDIDNLATVPANWIGSNLHSFTTNSNTTGVVIYARGENDNPSLENRIGEFNPILLEGDWTHLTEEDFNNLGKYKVEYKVVGKNKFPSNEKYEFEQNISKEYIIKNIYLRKGEHVISFNRGNLDINVVRCYLYGSNNELVKREDGGNVHYNTSTIKIPYSGYYKLRIDRSSGNIPITSGVITNLQIEEGTVATEYEPYKEYTKTFYLNSPLLEGDTIEDVNGVATHVKRYGKVVFDGREGWVKDTLTDLYTDNSFIMKFKQTNMGDDTQASTTTSGIGITNTLPSKSMNKDIYYNRTLNISCYTSGWREHFICLKNTSSLSDAKQWLQANPTTVVYKLASPIYEPISTESILCDSYVNGHLDVDSNIPISKVEFRDWFIGLQYLQANTVYNIQFQSDNSGLIDEIKLGHWSIRLASNVVVSKGINVIKVTTPNELVINMLYIRGIGFNASNVQVVATDRDNIGYFKGIQSSFEDKVIRSKNLFNKNNVVLNYGFGSDGSIINPSSIEHSTEYIECKPNTSYICNFGTGIHYFDENKTWISYQNHGTSSPSNAKYLVKCIGRTVDLNTVQIEEGIESTTYEEYNIYNGKYEVKVTLEDENGVISNEFIYLNSPLLKGDKIEMHNGKLCHYHKMGKVVLDGSEDEEDWSLNSASSIYYSANIQNIKIPLSNTYSDYIPLYCDTRNATYPDAFYYKQLTNCIGVSNSGGIGFSVDNFTSGESVKQWLQENPTTVVYELAEPYYEDITPIQNEFVITSIGESSFTIDSGAIPTDGEITYSVNVKLLNDLEESINNNTSSTDTDLSTILDDIINE